MKTIAVTHDMKYLGSGEDEDFLNMSLKRQTQKLDIVVQKIFAFHIKSLMMISPLSFKNNDI